MSPYCDPSLWDVVWHAAVFGVVFSLPICASIILLHWLLDRFGEW